MKKQLLYIILILFSQASYAGIDADIIFAKKTIQNKGISDEIKTEYQILDDLENFDVTELNQIAKRIVQGGVFDEVAIGKLLVFIDQCLVSDDKKVVGFSLKLLFELYFYNKNVKNSHNNIVGSNTHRKNIIVGHLQSNTQYIREKSFSILAMYFLDEEYVVSSLLNQAANPIKQTGFEKLNYIRVLGDALNDERIAIRDFLVNEVLIAKESSSFSAITVQAAHDLSKLSKPPNEVLLLTIEMLEGPYFGDTLLLKAISNYGVLMKPYLERMRVLQKQVDKRILYGRDNKGKGSSTFKKRQFHHVLKEIETM